jgi:hypothetical protein
MNLSLINQNIEAQTKAGEEAKRFQTALAALDKACKDNKFKDYADFLDQVAVYEGKAAPAEKPAKEPKPKTTKAKKSSGGTDGRGNRISAEKRAAVIEDLKAGKTGAEVAAAHTISLPSVSGIKKAAGLTKSREKKKNGAGTEAASAVSNVASPDAANMTG